ncbi:MAG: exo-alpha-sialidase [Actinomycetota bacterium]|nr:exo-alpha-sialidase [Actinomycetota bacterium]
MKRSFRPWAVLAAGVMGVVLFPVAAPAAGPPALIKPVQATKVDLDPGRLYSSPALAVDPTNPLRIVGGYADLRTRRCGVVRSVDGGQTWVRPDASPDTADFPFCSQSQGGVIQAPVAFGGGGMLYMALNGWGAEEAARTGGAVLLARSADLGDSWDTVVVHSARGKTGDAAENTRPVQSIAVERRSGKDDAVYLTYALSRPGLAAPNAAPASPMVAVSHDGGRTFAESNLVGNIFEPQAVRDQALGAVTTTTAAPGATTTTTTVPAAGSKAAQPNQAANFGAAGTRNGMVARVDSKGTAYVMWPTGTANITPSPPGGLALSKSTDGGKTWSSALAIPFSYDNATGGPASAYPQLAISPAGTLHIVYNRNPTPELAGASEVYERFSSDGGTTWSPPKVLSDDDPKNFGGQYFPNLSIAPNGRIDIAWWDTRDKQGMRATDVYYTYSTDDGRTWSKNQRITDQSVDRRLGIWGNNYDIASQPGVASTNAYAVFGWDDTRNSDKSVQDNTSVGGGLQDVYLAAAQFEAIGGGGSSRTAKVVLAGALGLLVVGVAVLLAAMATRRRAGGPPPLGTTSAEEARARAT